MGISKLLRSFSNVVQQMKSNHQSPKDIWGYNNRVIYSKASKVGTEDDGSLFPKSGSKLGKAWTNMNNAISSARDVFIGKTGLTTNIRGDRH